MSTAVDAEHPASRYAHVNARLREYQKQRPPLGRALRVDALRFAAQRGERHEFRMRLGEWINVLKMIWVSEDYLGVALYRVRAALQAHGVPVIPALLNKICVSVFRMEIGDGVVVREGLCVPQGNVILAGVTIIGRNNTLGPWSGTGCQVGSFFGPILGDDVTVAANAIILGEVTIGDGARLGPGAYVESNVGVREVVAGVPARHDHERPGAS